MALEKDFCTTSGNSLECLQHTDDDFVWVFNRAPKYDSTMSLDEQNKKFESRFECTDSNLNEDPDIDGIASDFLEDSYYDQFEPILQKVSHDKKTTKQRQRRGISSKTVHNPEEDEKAIHPALNMFDETTTGILKSIVAYNNYCHGEFCNFISKGINSVVIYASICKSYPLWHPKVKSNLHTYQRSWKSWRSEDYAVKVYKLSENVQKNEQIYKRVQKEKEHLILLHRAKCNVPEVKRCNRNVIATSLLGVNGETAPTISTLPLKPLETYHTIVKNMKMWYNSLDLIHGRLSPYSNILYWNHKVHYIGWSHSIKKEHPLALKKLMRDCVIITKFFEERLESVKSSENLFKDITGLKEIDNSVLSTTHSMDLWKGSTQHLANPNRVFSHSHSKERSSRFKWKNT